MAYNKISNKTQDKDVQYLSKDFNSFKSKLSNFAEVYFPNTYNDFSENNPATMFMEMAAYVGDVLSFYTDTQIKETFLSLAQERENIYNIAYMLGYKPKVTTAASVRLEIMQLLPSKGSAGNYLPDMNYALTLKASSTFETDDGKTFYLPDDVRFAHSQSLGNGQWDTTFGVYQFDSSNNPEYYVLRKTTPAISATVESTEIELGAVEKFKTITLSNNNIISIESIVDSDGNEYHEVDYLAQDTKFVDVPNTAANDPELHQYNYQAPYLLKIQKVPRRFVTRFKSDNTLEIQFGAGISDKADETIIPNPDNIGLGIKDGRSKLDKAYDPSNFIFTKAYGQVPHNTTLTITYLVGGGLESNVSSNTIKNRGFILIDSKPNLNNNLLQFCKQSLAATNPNPARGGGRGDTVEDIRLNAMANFAAQKRAITKEDYIIRSLSMDPKFGRVTKAYITQDDQLNPNTTEINRIPNPLALNLYTLGYNENRKLVKLNQAVKRNLATYLEQYRMLTDAINIKDAFIINFVLDFTITTYKNSSNQEALLECITELKDYFDIDKWQINQPIIISEIENLLGGIKKVQTVEDVTIKVIAGSTAGYSPYTYDFNAATKNNVIYPSLDPCIFELKYPDNDIRGKVTTY
jgi:hypothetical protein